MTDDLIKPIDAAKMLGVTVQTLRRSLVNTGKIKEITVTPRRRFFEKSAVESILRGEGATHAGA